MEEILLNKATYNDIYTHLQLCNMSFNPSLSSYVNLEEYSSKLVENAITIEAWKNKQLIGLVSFYLNDVSNLMGYISNVSILNDYQGKGIAKELLLKTISIANEKSYKYIALEVESDNLKAIRLYQTMGFVLNGKSCSKYKMLNRLTENRNLIVSICCVTYNHENYITKAIESFLMQRTNFPIEILIHDDSSTDGTADIIRQYEKKYPNLIKPIYQTENQYSKGVGISVTYQFPRAKGKYIAICEGDDYWTNPLKLQKQVDFLEANQEYSLCIHDVKTIFEGVEKVDPFSLKWKRNDFTFEDSLNLHFIPTLSMMFKTEYIRPLPIWFSECMSGDIPLSLILLSKGKGHFIREIMGVKRKNAGGLTANPERRNKKKMNFYHMYKNLYRYTNYRYKHLFRKKLAGYEISIAKDEFRKKKLLSVLNFTFLALSKDPLCFSKNFKKKLTYK